MESCVICLDSSEFMRNGDFIPSRLSAQEEAVNMICQSKRNKNAENCLALLSLTSSQMLVTLTRDVTKIMTTIRKLQPKGKIELGKGLQVAHLCLKHRQGRDHAIKIIVFVGSPVIDEESDLVILGKRLRKEKVSVDVINFGEESINVKKLESLITTLNGKDGENSHLITVPPETRLSEVLVSSPIMAGSGGGAVPGNYEFGVDPNEDPELAMVLRVSMEEERSRIQQQQHRVPSTGLAGESRTTSGTGGSALTSMMQGLATSQAPELNELTEEQQLHLAMQMSLQPMEGDTGSDMDIIDMDYELDDDDNLDDDDDLDGDDLVTDPNFLSDVIGTLPGVDANKEDLVKAIQEQNNPKPEDKDKDDDDNVMD
ncbi:26S proteasome non-ATPase regulatory subunit 4 isoform X2 [Oopsacas minuta]|uniref:26S proteasome non-ATPase regulatory subunit 4 n=1 Tax=Oopsacas minuta TaxID=111878 RepID=A0AAV7JE79_9METZ|nr:26S proteasome non-ATPase regulatory subunit 4 isoform X2 [Oopsacas minuta]